MWKSFSINLLTGILQLLATSSRTIFSGFSSMNTFVSLLLVLVQIHPWNYFLFFMLVALLQLVHEMSSLPEMFYRKSVLKNSFKFTRSSDPKLFCQKSVLEKFAKFFEKHMCNFNILIKSQTGKLKLYLKRLQQRCFLMNVPNFLYNIINCRTSTSGRFLILGIPL